ncbi:hypothetical protein [Gallalistipes aquisgranensis]|uniref:hypothetical protein n=1 Tax=Gallalistipes aquisgranensis TaxID=2779358 RepID=UPI001CF84758|nr:hypothetical protein [Gallalistipes aquisgranensis]MBE5033714.1 hypothetical protein [Gallalistipes aquisgranensis]
MKSIFEKIGAALGCCLLALSFSCSSGEENGEPTPPPAPAPENDGYELSYWIDMDMFGNHLRGYWYNVTERSPENIPEPDYVKNACKRLRNDYHANKLYVVYHRQFEASDAQYVLRMWKTFAEKQGMTVVPTVVLQSYGNPQNMNFSDTEIVEFAQWCIANTNADEFAIYDVYTRDAVGSTQANQIGKIREAIGDKLTRVGLQPGVALLTSYRMGVEDTWTAECQGRTNDLWENPVYYKGTKNYGRILLENWVNERINGDSRKIVWNMIPVAWDYDTDDELSYDCPGDDQYKNDPPVPGRIALCHRYISQCYPAGMKDAKFGGYSCDLHILQANSGGRGESPSFYEALRTDTDYTGDFADAMKEIGALYNSLNGE